MKRLEHHAIRRGVGQLLFASTCLLLSDGCAEDNNSYYICPFHCWESYLARENIPEHEVFEGYFPDACDNPGGGANLAPLPDLGYFGRYCTADGDGNPYVDSIEGNSEVHFLLKHAIVADIAGETLTAEEEDAYEEWVAGIVNNAKSSCKAALTCNGEPDPPCDIDPSVTGYQACTWTSAESICNVYVKNVLDARLALPMPDQYPVCAASKYIGPFNTKAECQGYSPDLNGTDDGCLGDDSGAGGQGADETGSGMFGDVGLFVSCTHSTESTCAVDRQLILNVMLNFSTFNDEGVEFNLVDSGETCGPGVKVTGLDSGEDATELANEFLFSNGDIIYEVNGISLDSTENAAIVLDELAAETSFTVKRYRRAGQTCTSHTYYIDIE